jgi:hypothetical protein
LKNKPILFGENIKRGTRERQQSVKKEENGKLSEN